MNILRLFGLFTLVFLLSSSPATAAANELAKNNPTTEKSANQQQTVESVDIQGNRRLRDEDLLYYIKTRPGDVYNQAQLERDLKELLSLNFFDKIKTRVLTEEGVRGGVNVIFEVQELPIIRDLQFQGLKAVPESDVLKAFREGRVGISKEAVYDPVKARNAVRILREQLASKGFPNATIEVKEEEVSATSTAITFVVDQGNRSRIVNIEFEGNQVFKSGELRNQLLLVKETGLISRFKGTDILDLRKLQYDLQKNVRQYMFSKGYFQARIGEPQVVGLGYKRTGVPLLGTLPLPLLSSKDDTLKVIVPVTEGKLFRVGELKVEGNSIFSEQQILGYIGLQKGEIANGKRLQEGVYENLKKVYGSQGFVLYNAEFDPEFKDNPANASEGIVDITITIDEGKQFRLRRLEFTGNTFTRDKVLRREFLINEGDIYNQQSLEVSILRLNQTGYFDPLDKDKDAEIRTNEEQGDVDLIISVKEKGRQQISFNGGVSGIGGSFFGLEYSTNNLLGRGEVLSFQFGVGNRQQSFQFSYQNPYFRDRPISIGFSLLASRYKFFGQGTFLSQNQSAISSALDPLGSLTGSDENLFTQNTYSASLFATAPLSEFLPKRAFSRLSRIGLTYQISATTLNDPKVNQSGNSASAIPVIFATPNIITSRITPTFVYDSREPSANGIDTLRGKSISASLGLAGLGGDVRTYQPTISYTEFIPIRRRRSKNAEVFGYRLQAGTVGSFGITNKIRNANSLSFVGGVPYYERYFLGSEYDIRGYDSRTIGPIAPYNTYITSRNVSVATNASGTPLVSPLISSSLAGQLAEAGTLNGVSGGNATLASARFQPIGGDTQLLGNFEYRIPIFGPVSLAAFADIGTVFNLRKTGTQNINSTFLADDTFLSPGTLTSLLLRNNPQLPQLANGYNVGSFLFLNDHLITTGELVTLLRANNQDQLSQIQSLYIRGEAQTNSQVLVDQSFFNKFGDYRASVGMELRVQVPIVNVPFRLIYFYNPNANITLTEQLFGQQLQNKRNGFKFTVGRTF